MIQKQAVWEDRLSTFLNHVILYYMTTTRAIGPKGKICFITPVEETKEIYYCGMIKERILWGTDDKGVVNVVVDKGKLHI